MRRLGGVNSNLRLVGKQVGLGFSFFVLVVLFILFIANSFAVLEPISSIEVQSITLDNKNNVEGSFKYTKSAKWISRGKARINIKLESVEKPRADYTDVILVLDTSGSMAGDKLTQVQSDVNEFINDTIPKGNKVALITFNDVCANVTNFTSDTSLLKEIIDGLTIKGETNYYQALVKVDDVLSSYNKESDRDCVVLFLTDGLPTVDIPNEVGQYNYLKSKYEYLSINGIQYELGDEVLEGLKNITDIQFIASTKNLSEFLYKASISPIGYDKFVLTDYIETNNFNLKDASNIITTFGNVSVDEDQVIWNLNGFKTGLDAELTIDINLNEELIGLGGVYQTHTKTDVSYKIGDVNTTETVSKTTALKDNYVVIYDANAPNGCVVSNLPSSKVYSVFDTVKISDDIPTCSGYQFKEWKIVTDDVEKIGNNQFIMPESNVTIKAVWKKLGLVKSMDGKISTAQSLYRMIADNSKGVDTSVNFSQIPISTNSGIYTRSGTENGTYPVYYYRGIINNNNVLFAGFCWKIVRTTSTGGVKLIYNGVYDENKKCNNTDVNSQIGISKFNSSSSSPADVGYMYGTRYTHNNHSLVNANVLNQYTATSSSYYYGKSITYSNGRYTLVNAEQKSWADNYSSLSGYYTCRSTADSCATIYYIVGTDSNYQYVLHLSGGVTDPATQTITLGKNMKSNGDSTYSLENIVVLRKIDWYQNYATYSGYYMCSDLKSTTCSRKYYISSTSNASIKYDDTLGYIYGNDVSWDGNKYTLIDTYTSELGWNGDKVTLAKKYHYTCFNATGECSSVYYIHQFGNSSYIYYLTLSSGKNIEDAKNEMFTSTNDSTIKKTIDSWYKSNMLDYTVQLEDTIWCNDRSFYSGSLVGKDEDAGVENSYFSTYNRIYTRANPSVGCVNQSRDGFTVSTSTGGNGALTYPVGLLTADEVMLAGGKGGLSNTSYYLYTGQLYWILSSSGFYSNVAGNFRVRADGRLSDNYVNYSYGVRPSVSLVKGTRYMDGNGTADNPFVIGDE